MLVFIIYKILSQQYLLVNSTYMELLIIKMYYINSQTIHHTKLYLSHITCFIWRIKLGAWCLILFLEQLTISPQYGTHDKPE